MQDVFVHHVFFWLKEPGNNNSKQLLIEGLKKLSKVPAIKSFHIGKPAATNRAVIENTYSVSWLLTFDTSAAQDSYQIDPLHLAFVEECSALWEKVIVYDSIAV